MANARRFALSPMSAALVSAMAMAIAGLPGVANASDDVWPTLRSEMFGTKPIAEDTALLQVDAPYRADDAALVPVTVKIPAAAGDVRKLTLIVEKNPAPMAATFTFGPASAAGERTIATRLRFDMYSNLRVVAEMADGSLHMATRFVKAAGGCSAPAMKDAEQALAQLGRSMIKDVGTAGDAASGTTRIGQVMVKHPNYSGMQMDQVTGYFIPAKYVTTMRVARGNQTVFDLEAGISLSEDPNIRFTYEAGASSGASSDLLAVTTTDSDGRQFQATAAPAQSGS